MTGWYQKFIRGYASLTSPLTDALKHKKHFEWSEDAEKSFQTLKAEMCKAPVLHTPNFEAPFFIHCDASHTGVGGVLMQVNEENDEVPIAYMSRKLNKCQRNYSVTEKECFAAILSIKKFRPYVEGHAFTVITDHASLKWLMSQSDLSTRLARWALKLQAYTFEIQHRKAQMILGNELEQLYRVAAAEASSMDSLQLRRLKDDFTHHKNLFIQQRKGLQMSMEINKVMAENFPYFEEEYEDKFISLISKTSMILRRISLKETAANEIKHQKPWWHDFRFGNDRDDSLSLFASKTQSKSVTQKVTTNKPWYDFTFGDNRDQENMPKSKAENNLKSKYHLEKDTFGINYSFPPAKKQWEEEGEQQVTQKEVSPEKALLKLTDPKKFEDLLSSSHIMLTKERKNVLPKQREQDLEKKSDDLLGNSHIMLTEERKNALPRQREQDLEKKQLELEKKQLNLEKQQLELEKKQLNLEKQQKREMQLMLEKLQNLESQQKLEKQLNLERQQNLEKLQNLERQLKLEKQQHLEKLQNLEKRLELEKLQNLENQQKLEKQLKLEKQQKLRKQQKLEIQQELEKNRKFVSFPPAKKQREKEGEQQVAKKECAPKMANNTVIETNAAGSRAPLLPSDIDFFKAKTASVMRQLAALNSFVTDELNTFDEADLLVRLETVEGMRAEFESSQSSLEKLDLLELAGDARSDFAQLYWEAKSKLSRKLDIFGKSRSDCANSTAVADHQFSASHTQSHRSRLPELQLPKFSGCYEDWPDFYAMFNTVIGNEQELSTHTGYIRAISTMSSTTELADGLLIHIIGHKLDQTTQEKWEESLPTDKLPKWTDMATFLEKRCRMLENVDSAVSKNPSQQVSKHSPKSQSRSILIASSPQNHSSCPLCNAKDHFLSKCSKFLSLSPQLRHKEAKRMHLCLNCLRKGHVLQQCRSGHCKHCPYKHHSLLHMDANQSSLAQAVVVPQPTSSSALISTSSDSPPDELKSKPAEYVLLPTAIIYAKSRSGTFLPCRALLDSASQLNFITARLAKQLQLKTHRSRISISGIGESSLSLDQSVDISAESHDKTYTTSFSAVIARTITDYQPHFNLNIDEWNIPKNIKLADPLFNESQRIDLLLGAGLFFDLICVGQIRIADNLPSLQKTRLGWICLADVQIVQEDTRHWLLYACYQRISMLRSH
ncbi:hypothetical protein ACLKA6_010232 [Drosophila palustris]